MFFFQTMKMCVKNIFSNKLRSFLSMLGIIIGISSVIVLVGFTEGTSEEINSSLQNLGANVVTLNVTNDDDETLTYDEVKDVNFSFAEDVLMKNQSRGFVKNGATSGMYTLSGVTANFLEINKFSLQNGRDFAALDVDNEAPVVILGATVSTDLFENDDPVGEKIRIGTSYYTVIGVLSANSSSDSDYDSAVIIPLTTYAKQMDDSTISTMYFVGEEGLTDTRMMEQMMLRSVGNYISTDNLEIVTKDDVSSTISEVDEMTVMLISLIGIISLVVSGVGVMNIMIVSVAERTREIGVRKAIGATDFDILKQFLIEAILITSFGGVLGISIGYLFKVVANFINISFVVNQDIVLLSFGFSILVGLIFGIIPAIRASKLKPIEALKYD